MNKGRRKLFIQEGKGTQVRTISGRANDKTQVKIMQGQKKEGKQGQEVKLLKTQSKTRLSK